MAKVVVVDDADSELQLMESILRSAGHEVVTILAALRRAWIPLQEAEAR
jgi:CheY-like chemotaxis protein